MACSASRFKVFKVSASDCGVSAVCGKCSAAPCFAMNSALSRWWLVVLTISGTSSAGTPAAQSSLTVMAPARQTIRSQSARRLGMSSMKASTSAFMP